MATPPHKKLIEPARQSTNGVHVNMLNTQVGAAPEDDEAAAARSVARVNAHHEAKTCFDTELMQLQVGQKLAFTQLYSSIILIKIAVLNFVI